VEEHLDFAENDIDRLGGPFASMRVSLSI